jgi:urease accessory protein
VSGGWRGELALHYRRDAAGRCVAHDRHHGPLRVLQPLYPEGPGICHHVIVHPPGGVVGGDELAIELTLEPGTHAVVTTPGATRFYRSDGARALQHARLRIGGGARLEWLPLETIAHPGCRAESRVEIAPEPGAEAIGWEVLALGLPASEQPFDDGAFTTHLALPGRWLERGTIAGDDHALRHGPVGMAGQPVLATAWIVAGTPWPAPRRDALLEVARQAIDADALLAPRAGATSPQPGVIVARVLAPRVEPALALLRTLRAAWRRTAWGLAPVPPRIWRT